MMQASGNTVPLSVPPDVVFAQKASALVKAAGMDPRLLDLEKFRQMSHIICCRVYQVIFKEKPDGFIDVPQHQDDFVENIQLVINSLRDRIEDPSVLNEVSGQNICFGSHRSIAILVNILFLEGQRIWRLRQESGHRGQSSSGNNNNNNNQHNLNEYDNGDGSGSDQGSNRDRDRDHLNSSDYNNTSRSNNNNNISLEEKGAADGDIPKTMPKQRPHSASNIHSAASKKDKNSRKNHKINNYYEDILVNDHALWNDSRSPEEIEIDKLKGKLKDYEGILERQELTIAGINRQGSANVPYSSSNPNSNPLFKGGSPNSKNRLANLAEKKYNMNQKQMPNQKGRIRVREVIKEAHQFENFMENAKAKLVSNTSMQRTYELDNDDGSIVMRDDSDDPVANNAFQQPIYKLRRPSSAPTSRKVSKPSERLYNPNSYIKAKNSLERTVPRYNRAKVLMALGNGSCSNNYYCGRQMGVDKIPESSDGVCGPYSGAQCPDCKGFTLTEFRKIASSSANNAEIKYDFNEKMDANIEYFARRCVKIDKESILKGIELKTFKV